MARRPHRPFRITMLALLVLNIAAWSLIRVITGIVWGQALKSYASDPGPIYVILTGAAWTVVGIILVRGILKRLSWAPRACLVAAYVYAGWVWIDRLAFQGSTLANWRFAVIVSLLLLGILTRVLLDPRSQAYFRNEAHERKLQD